MTTATLAAAKECDFRIAKLRSFISTAKRMPHFCDGFGVWEEEETTNAMKDLLLADLEHRLAAEEKKFTEL